MRPDPSCLDKNVRKIKAELLKQYIMSLKNVICKNSTNRNEIQ